MIGPRLETTRLILRPPVEGDLDGWAALDADERVTRYIGGAKGREQAWLGLATAAGMWTLRGCGLFSVIEKHCGTWVGRVGPWLPEGAIGTEIGWAFAGAAQGKGYATESARAATGWAFDTLGWTEVIHCIDVGNTSSIAVARRLGSTWLRAATEADGKVVQVYGQTRGHWLASGAA
ncbi:GNAT family N-acetyltransferase [Caulobacter sp. DWR1-3-2b1]|uniref:GNAT family N-acetyltransferase n=1 Tax=Caulobacter sp. DWR1-3-2b1 TaxID=2804670 RepID=UPI003CE6EACD